MEPLEVYGQEGIRDRLLRSVRSGLLGNSLLFDGAFGVGKERTAFWLAQLVLCEQGTACGGCTPCRKVLRLTHPDLHWMVPAPGEVGGQAGGDEEGTGKRSEREKFVESAMESRREEPFFVPTSHRQLGHSASSIRQLISWCSKRPYEAERKVVIIRDADRMAPGIANLFLKLLEEPPVDTILILTTALPHRLLPTVLSRCLVYRFPLVERRLIERVLGKYRGVPRERAAVLARLAQGSLLRAIELAGGDDDLRGEALRVFGIASIGRIGECYDIIEDSPGGGSGRNRSEVLDRMLFFMQLVLRDLMLFAEGGGEESVVNIDLVEKMRRIGDRWDRRRMGELLLRLERIRSDLEYHVNPDLALWYALDSIRTALHEALPLAEPAESRLR
jgi:DNA polymerase-3 subunit delta'